MTLRNWLLACALSPLCVAMANATDTEFDPTMLMTLPNQPAIDIGRFNQSGAVVAGVYRLDVYVNDQWQGLSDVVYVDDEVGAKNTAILCVQDALLKVLDIQPKYTKALTRHKKPNGCYALGSVVDGVQTKLDMGAMRLDIQIPQIYLMARTDDDIDPTDWDKGINSAFVSYQFNHHHSSRKNQHHETYLGLNAGFNWSGWYFRHQGSARDTDNSSPRYQPFNTYVNTAIPRLKSQLTLGDFYSDGALFDGTAMRGVQMTSDSRMLPASLQGYAPTIQGFVNSTATVSILQNNQEIYSTTVPAGAFLLNNVRDIGGSGDLTVVITEADGRQTRQVVPYYSTIALLRPNRHHYTYAFGRVRHQNTKLYDDHILQGTWQRGLTNTLTMNVGGLYARQYQSWLLGGAFNTKWGAFSLNALGTQYTPYGQTRQNGQQIRLQYNRLLPNAKTALNASLWWYDRHQNLENVLRSHKYQTPIHDTSPKVRYQVSISQPLGSRLGSLYGFFGRTAYDHHHQDQWQAGYSNRIGALSYGVSVQNLKTDTANKWETQYLLNASLPFGGDSRHYANSFLVKTDKDTHWQTGFVGSFESLPHLDYSVNVGRQDRDDKVNWSANVNYQTPLVRLSSTYSHSDAHRQYAFGASGAVVAHQGGITGANQLGETFAIVHLPNGQGAKLDSVDNVAFDKKGYAVLPNLSPYRPNVLTVNPEGLPYDVQLDETGSRVVPVANASVLVKFNSRVSKTALLNVKFANGSYPPIGASVYDNDNTAVGFVAQDGRVFLQNAQEKGLLSVHFNGSHCKLTYQLPPATPNMPIATADAICR